MVRANRDTKFGWDADYSALLRSALSIYQKSNPKISKISPYIRDLISVFVMGVSVFSFSYFSTNKHSEISDLVPDLFLPLNFSTCFNLEPINSSWLVYLPSIYRSIYRFLTSKGGYQYEYTC